MRVLILNGRLNFLAGNQREKVFCRHKLIYHLIPKLLFKLTSAPGSTAEAAKPPGYCSSALFFLGRLLEALEERSISY